MDDHDLGALLDATVPSPATATNATLIRIRGRAGQYRRRTALVRSALTVAVGVAAALGISALGATSRTGSVAPGGPTNPQRGTTTIVPDGRCFPGDVTLQIGVVSDSADAIPATTSRFTVAARSRADAPCRLITPIKATIHDSAGRVLTSVAGTLTADVLPTDAGYVSELAPDTLRVLAYLDWRNPCSAGAVTLEAAGPSAQVGRLPLPRQPCAAGTTQSLFTMRPAAPVAVVMAGPGDFGDLYREHYPRLVRALVIAGAADAAEDLAQEAMARTLAKWRRVRKGTNPAGYVYTTAFRLLQRHRRRAKSVALIREPTVDGPEAVTVTNAVVAQALEAMPPARRAVAALCVSLGWSTDEAANALGITPSTARVQLHRAREDLHRALGEPAE
jgi:RNA polymerase sigma-70 factor (ECF subfamily)